MKIIGVIPARYASSRFPGKPLADICGKPMIWWVYQQAGKVKEFCEIYIATDDERIISVCNQYEMNVILTSDQHKTGTDRVCEVAKKVKADLYVNVQGDEPLIEPESISMAIKPFYENSDLQVSSLMSKIKNPLDVINPNVCKVVTNKDGFALYLTRGIAPYTKKPITYDLYKALGIFGIKPEAAAFFSQAEQSQIELIEEIEMLRFIENGYRIHFKEVDSKSIGVDTASDLEKVRQIITKELAG
ncbi:MAG: 3-deoxy-manno-octulosonate cytidylyltransferase [Lachnospiraceae bacterium]|nr:3-deoxy-manno-octulosonate cytidylyltransferase [Lachnospiraceae bacterium]